MPLPFDLLKREATIDFAFTLRWYPSWDVSAERFYLLKEMPEGFSNLPAFLIKSYFLVLFLLTPSI